MSKNFESQFGQIDDLLSEIKQSANDEHLFVEIDQLCGDVDAGFGFLRNEVLKWSNEKKLKEAIDSQHSFVLDMLSLDDNEIITNRAIINPHIAEGSLLRLINQGQRIEAVLQNPSLPRDLLNRIADKYSSTTDFLIPIFFHPQADNLIKQKVKQPDVQILLPYVESHDRSPRNTAIYLIENNQYEFVAEHLDKFQDLDFVVAEALIKKGCGYNVVQDIDYFQGLNRQDIVETILNYKENNSSRLHGIWAIARYLDKFPGLDHQYFAKIMIEKGFDNALAEYLGNFKGLNHQDIANIMIKGTGTWALAEHLGNFQGLNHQDIAKSIIKRGGYLQAIAKYLDNFQGLNHQDIAKSIIKNGLADEVAKYLEKFKELDSTIAENMIKKSKKGVPIDICRIVATKLEKFQNVNFQAIAEALIEKKEYKTLAVTLGKFKNLNSNIAKVLIENGYGKDVEEKWSDVFPGLDYEKIINSIKTISN